MRSFLISLENNQIKSKNRVRNIRYFIYAFFIYLLALNLMTSSVAILNGYMFWRAIIDLYYYVHQYSVDFYFIYLVFYVIILQNLFNDNLSQLNSITTTLSDVKYLKYKFLTIQSFIAEISKVLSPILLIHCSNLTYQFIVNSYFCFNSILRNNNNNYKSYAVFVMPFYLFITTFVQLLTISLCAENVNKKVRNYIFQKTN